MEDAVRDRVAVFVVVAGPVYVSTNPTLMVSPATPDPAMQNVERTTARNNTTFLIACPPL
jgi:FlaG/FlaF family flagellin (archaellin)